jgi:hypothetical protein
MPQEDPLFVATLRAVFRAEDEVSAIMIADQIKVNGEKDLDQEDGDTLDVTQVTQNLINLSPEETTAVLRRARNLLIRTRVKSCFEVARELDKCIYMLKHRAERNTGFELAGYDYGQFMDIAEEVLAGGNPIH